MIFWNKYHKEYFHFQNDSHSMQLLIAKILEECHIKQNTKVLDAGCGNGSLLTKLDKLSIEVTGLDYSFEAVEIAKKRVTKSKILMHDLRKRLPFKENYFDFVICVNTLYTLGKEGFENVLMEFERVLKPGGQLLVTDPRPNFSNLRIFFSDLEFHYVSKNIFRTILHLIKNFSRYVKLYYYNIVIDSRAKKSHYFYPTQKEYVELVSKHNFFVKKVSLAYCNQNNLVVAEKND